MVRVIDPPREQHSKLLTPLTAAEQAVLDLFDKKLSPEWEIYVHPHLNGLRPDLVLLNPKVGIAVFEISQWNLDAMQLSAKRIQCSDRDESDKRDRADRLELWGVDERGVEFSVEHDNPMNRARHYKKEIFDLYCPRLDAKAGFAVVTAGLIFPDSSRARVMSVFGPFRDEDDGMRDYPRYYPLAGAEDIASGSIQSVFPEGERTSSWVMTPELADDLRGWLKEPFFSQEQRTPLVMDARQRELASSRSDTGYRRIKGPAGSGKSLILAARASTLAAEGKRVLVVSYNITLLNYLRDLAERHIASRIAIHRQIDFLNFHAWCHRVCATTGHLDEYKHLWASSSDGVELIPEPVLNEGLAGLVQELYAKDQRNALPKYDAILVDEGQDLRLSWWQSLRLALKPGGEMVLVADKTQNIYSTAAAWTEDSMAKAGFRGPWVELKISYRLPPSIVPLVARFAEEFMSQEEIDIPYVESDSGQVELPGLFPVELRWVQVLGQTDALDVCAAELRRMMQRLRTDTAIPDITVLTGTKLGRRLVARLATRNVRVVHTFDVDKRVSRRQKVAFFQDDARIKATTLHSFKGWEARHLVLYVDSIERPEDRALIYTALTRLRRHQAGSALTVVSSCPELSAYGRSWPEFAEA